MFIPKVFLQMAEPLTEKEKKEKMDTVRNTLDILFSDDPSRLMDYKKIYEAAEDLVKKKQGEPLYKLVKDSFKRYSKQVLKTIDDFQRGIYLKKVKDVWERFKLNLRQSRDLLLYFDENYIEKQSTHEKRLLTVYQSGVDIFKTVVMVKIVGKIKRIILEIIDKERNNEEMSNKFLLKAITEMMSEIDKEIIYRKGFEEDLIKTSHEYYKKESQKIFEETTAVGYLEKVTKRLSEERERSKRCFDKDTLCKMEEVVHKEMIYKYKEDVVNKPGSGVLVMLENKKAKDLKLVYSVLSLVEHAMDPTVNMIKEFITKEGITLVDDEKKSPLELVEDVIKIRKYYEELLGESFSKIIKGVIVKDKDCAKAVKEAFQIIVNKNERFPEFLSLLLDKSLKKGRKQQLDEDDNDQFFDDVILTFHHVREKDVFEKYYKMHLAKRLLSGRSASDDAEKIFLSKLKTSFGYQFTSKLEGMFKDMKISEELMSDWKKYRNLKKGIEKKFDLSCQILTHVYWPLGTPVQVNLPEAKLGDELILFEDYYQEKHNGRKLTWQYNMGTVDIIGNGFNKKYTFSVSTYQMLVLLLFNNLNDGDTLKVDDVQKRTLIPMTDLKRNLYALCVPCEKGKKISRLIQRNNKKLDSETKLKLNKTFKSQKNKVKILPVVKKEDDLQRKDTFEKISEERKWIVDAAVVRIMKSRKKLQHRQLVVDVIEQLKQRFTPTPDTIKKRIESLIDREYLERDENNRANYKYLA